MNDRSAVIAPLTDWSLAIRPRARIGHTIEVHETIGSTNDRARELLDEDGGEGGVVLAEEQTAGRGRRGRSWMSPAGVNLTLSVALRPALAAADAWQLGLATALATLEACLPATPRADLGLKWPNDVVDHEGGKVAGLLIETMMSGDRLTGAVAGIGINVNWLAVDMPAEISGRATSLAALSGADVDRVALLDRLLDALDREVAGIEAGRSPLGRYRAACLTIGQDVTVEAAAGLLHGRAIGLDETGSLLLQVPGGQVALSSGEVASVRPEALA